MPCAQIKHRTRRIELAAQIDARHAVFAGKYFAGAIEAIDRHQCCINAVVRGESRLRMFSACAFATGLMIAAGEAVGDAEGVTKCFRIGIQ